MGKLRPEAEAKLGVAQGHSTDHPPPWFEGRGLEQGTETGLASGLQGQWKVRFWLGQMSRLSGTEGGDLREEKEDKWVNVASIGRA